MEIKNAVSVVKPEPDSHFRLLNCGCGSDNVAYVEDVSGDWAVRCFDCGHQTDPAAEDKTRHGIQQIWNGGGRYGQ